MKTQTTIGILLVIVAFAIFATAQSKYNPFLSFFVTSLSIVYPLFQQVSKLSETIVDFFVFIISWKIAH